MMEFNQIRGGADSGYLLGMAGTRRIRRSPAARQGAKVGYFTALGDDAFGREFQAFGIAKRSTARRS